MRRDQTAHERLIPLLCDIIGAQTYLEFGTHMNETISKVRCPHRHGVDTKVLPTPGVMFHQMTTTEFIASVAASFAPYDVVFIDADHSGQSVRDDYHGIWQYVSDDGLILLHDTNPATEADTAPGFCGDAWRFALEIQMYASRTSAAGGLPLTHEAVTLPFHPGLTIIRKRKQWGPAA